MDIDESKFIDKAALRTPFALRFAERLRPAQFVGGPAKLVIWNANAVDPRAYFIYVVPANQSEHFLAGHSYVSRELPALTKSMFQRYEELIAPIEERIDAFLQDLRTGSLLAPRDLPTRNAIELLHAFERRFPELE